MTEIARVLRDVTGKSEIELKFDVPVVSTVQEAA